MSPLRGEQQKQDAEMAGRKQGKVSSLQIDDEK